MACCCFKTGMRAAWHAATAACVRVCVAAFVVDTIRIPADTSAQTAQTQAWRIELLYKNIRVSPELALLSGSILFEYFYTEIRFSTPALSAPLSLAGEICLSK
jgi:hypothetical protein